MGAFIMMGMTLLFLIVMTRKDPKVKRYESVLEDIRDNYDCDSDAHKYGTACRACISGRALAGKDPWRND